MTYRELLETLKKKPECLWTYEQWKKQSDNRYSMWVKEHEPKSK